MPAAQAALDTARFAGHLLPVRCNAGALCALALLLTAASPGETDRWYVVREGDTLTRIATRHGVSVEAVASGNGMDPRAILRIGQKLRIPPATPGARAPIETRPLPQDFNRPADAPAAKPLATQRPETSPAAPAAPDTHVIAHGDTLYGIARKYGVPMESLTAWNAMNPKEVLRIGQRLRLRPPGTSAPPQAAAAPQPNPPQPPPAPPTQTAPATQPQPQPPAPRTERPAERPTVEPKPDAAPEPSAMPEEKEEAPAAAERSRTPSISSKQTSRGFRLPFIGRKTKPSGAFVHLRDVKEQVDKPRIKSGRWRYIVIHHSGTSKGSGEVFEHYHRMVRGMENGLAYHFVIGNGSYTGDGQIEVGDRWLKQKAGGHLYSDFLNEISIGICFVGNFNEEKPTARQIAACIELVDYLRNICPGGRPKFVLHREINPRPTECPGKLFPGEALRKRLK